MDERVEGVEGVEVLDGGWPGNVRDLCGGIIEQSTNMLCGTRAC